MRGASHRAVLWIALALCASKGLAAAWATPAFQTPDEYGHYDYVLYLSHIRWGAFLAGDVAPPQAYNDVTTEELWAVTRASGTESHLRGPGLRRPLPPLLAQVAQAAAFTPTDSHEVLRQKTVVPAQFNYPILYYGSVALVVKAVRTVTVNPVVAYYAARTTSLALLLLTVYFTWATARLVFAHHAGNSVALATLFTALQPQLTLLGTSVQSDMLTVLLVTMCCARAVRYIGAPTRADVVVLGVLNAALFLTKLHAAIIVLGAVIVMVALVERARPRVALSRVLLIAALALVLGGWWYVRTFVLYGSATGMVVGEFHTPIFGSRRENLRLWLSMLPFAYTSFWGNWGWLEVPLPTWAYRAFTIATVASLARALRPASVRAILQTCTAPGAAFWGLLTTGYGLIMIVVAVAIGPIHNNQGRHWLPIVIVPALLLGLCGSRGAWRSEVWGERVAVAGWMVLLLGANLVLILRTRAFYPIG